MIDKKTTHMTESRLQNTKKFTLDTLRNSFRSLLMALLSIQGDWYLYIWLIYCKIYSAIIWLFSNHCRGTDKARSVITSGVGGQSPGGLHRVRTRRRRAPQQHRVKHIVALARRPSLRRIVMAPGASTAHTMMEDKEKILNGALATGEFIVFLTIFV
ncbi:hypothetical protein HF086_002931 [Spodoptera exigua]|uniref:Uncharacterized protein n=1 Tax=Spodoptera exigua TaxID=7107 RepID=A0A922MCM2_SPOEX|nr:hypothetical protein HF086_002931 [Spodoptera exigua]